MLAIGIKKNDEVIVPPLSFIATAYAPLYCNAIPVFADIEKDTFNINPNDIKFQIWGNKFCPPFPNCMHINDPRVAIKDTSECS